MERTPSETPRPAVDRSKSSTPSSPLRPYEESIVPRSIDRFEPLVGRDVVLGTRTTLADLASRLAERCVWNVSSTPTAGGIAETLRTLLAYARGAGIDARWLVLSGTPDFFRIAKRVRDALHGDPGDGSPLGPAERARYESVSYANAAEMRAVIRPGDVVILHDAPAAGLGPILAACGAHIVWRCDVGADGDSKETELGWRFLAPYLARVSRFVFSRAGSLPAFIDRRLVAVVAPSIDPFCAKNQAMSADVVHDVLVHTGLVGGGEAEQRAFVRADGSPGRVDRCADVVRSGAAASATTPLVIQIARWDRLKDHLGVMTGFARLVASGRHRHAQLMLVGPNVGAVAVDPDGPVVFRDVIEAWRALPHAVRGLVDLVHLPSHDPDENAAIVNALQRHATVIVQKSLRDGFGLSITEAMWKERPVVASAVGGILDQIDDGVHGVLVRDPADHAAFADAVASVLADPVAAREMGRQAAERVRERSLHVRQLDELGRALLTML